MTYAPCHIYTQRTRQKVSFVRSHRNFFANRQSRIANRSICEESNGGLLQSQPVQLRRAAQLHQAAAVQALFLRPELPGVTVKRSRRLSCRLRSNRSGKNLAKWTLLHQTHFLCAPPDLAVQLAATRVAAIEVRLAAFGARFADWFGMRRRNRSGAARARALPVAHLLAAAAATGPLILIVHQHAPLILWWHAPYHRTLIRVTGGLTCLTNWLADNVFIVVLAKWTLLHQTRFLCAPPDLAVQLAATRVAAIEVRLAAFGADGIHTPHVCIA